MTTDALENAPEGSTGDHDPVDHADGAPTAEETALEDVLGHRFADIGLLRRALTHRSYAFEAGGIGDNERLEFLGDAVLGLVVTDEIYGKLPDSAEGRLAKVRAAAVNTISLAEVAREAGIGRAIRLGVGEQQSGGHDKDSILANTMEAILGAVYLDGGVAAATTVVMNLFSDLLEDIILRRESLDYKTSLQELTAAELSVMPVYLVSDSGPDHAKDFIAEVVIADEVLGTGTGRSKKEAEQGAAREAFAVLRGRQRRTPTPSTSSEHQTNTKERT